MNEIRYAGEPLLLAPGSAFVCPWGMTPGRGTFEADARAFSRIKQKLEKSAGSAKLVMTDGARSLTLEPTYLVSAKPVITRRGALSPGQDVASWRIELSDRRRVLGMKTISGRYNVLGPDRENYLGGSPLSWQDLVTLLADALGIAPLTIVGEPAGTPADVVWDEEPALDVLHALLGEVGQYLTYNPLADTWTVRKVGSIDPDDQADLDDLLMEFRLEGASAEKVTRPAAPASVDVLFPVHDTALADVRTDPDDRWYAVNCSAPEGLKTVAGTKAAIYYNDAYAIRVEGEVTNAEALETIATARASEFYARFEVTHADYELAGLHRLTPNSLIRRVIWVSDEEGARTLVRVGNPELGREIRNPKSEIRTTEGEGIFLQRGIGRTRIEHDRECFFGKVIEEAMAPVYKVRRVNWLDSWIGAEFDARDLTDGPTLQADARVLIVTDGEGHFVFVPFRRWLKIAEASGEELAMLREDAPDANDDGLSPKQLKVKKGVANRRRIAVKFDVVVDSYLKNELLVAIVHVNDAAYLLQAKTSRNMAFPNHHWLGVTQGVIGTWWIDADFEVDEATWNNINAKLGAAFDEGVYRKGSAAEVKKDIDPDPVDYEMTTGACPTGDHWLGEDAVTGDGHYGLQLRLNESPTNPAGGTIDDYEETIDVDKVTVYLLSLSA